ncbi:propionate--CoA ligase [Massilia sp. W12]|uniref:propionate--CoA ligase n=1 Tax=Massilia sp. W12 TaxID=3126507 RepID=UPI0030CAEE8D
MRYADFYQHSLQNPEAFWREQARLIDWRTPFSQVCDHSRPPFARWFVDGQTNLCHNALDRWLEWEDGKLRDAPALICISTETGQEKTYSFAELWQEVQHAAAILQQQGVGQGDMVLLYMPMIAEAAFFMLACARIGAVHSVVFGGFAAGSLATRIDSAQPKLIVSADAGSRGGKVIPYKPLLDEALQIAQWQVERVILVDRGLATMDKQAGRDLDYASLRQACLGARVPLVWLESNAPSYVLYTSGTTGKPKGVQRDVGGYAVALAASIPHIFAGKPGEVFFATSDIGWVVGHSYIVYGPLLGGMASIMYEGLPVRPDAGIWWSIVEKYRVTCMFTTPTAMRLLKKHPPELLKKYDLSSLHALHIAGEPLDEPTSLWIGGETGLTIIDNYWQTETGWPILSICHGVEKLPPKTGSPGIPVYGYEMQILNESTGQECGPGEKGVVAIKGPLPPGCMQTVFGDDERFVSTYWNNFPGRQVYSTFDWGIRDEDGYYFILGRSDDVINVAGHRLGTREIEESICSHTRVAECAVVGVQDQLKGQVAVAFVVLKPGPEQSAATLQEEIMDTVVRQLGAVARPAQVHFVHLLPKTRSGKMLRRALVALCEGRDTGDLSTLEDPASLSEIRKALQL